MCAVSQYLEEEGIATTLISLIKEHSDVMRPPRALWVPFMLGRPFGVPDNAPFQSRVLRAALDLLDAPQGPISEDFAEEAPGAQESTEDGDACPVHFAPPNVDESGAQALARALRDEVAQLQPWHDLTRRTLGRSTVGVSGMSIEDAAAYVAAQLETPLPAGDDVASHARRVKLACDDLRAYYEEAGAAQPGHLSPAALERWYYRDTAAGRVLDALRERYLACDAPTLRYLGQLVLIPRAILLEGK